MKNSKPNFFNFKICSLLLLTISIITNLEITVAKADGGNDSNSSSGMINLDQSSNQQSSQQKTSTNLEAGTHKYFPEVSMSQLNQLICYMKTDDGRTLNLIEICGQESSKK